MRNPIVPFLGFVAFLSHLATLTHSQQFQESVLPILQSRCVSCHNADDLKGGFSLTEKHAALASGMLEPGDPESSQLLDSVKPAGNDPPRMPKSGPPLTQQEIATLTQWIQSGAQWPDNLTITPPAITDLNWWSFQPLVKPQLPKLDNNGNFGAPVRSIHPIDQFLEANRRELELTSSPEAPAKILLRRLFLDLTGLPPTKEELAEFERTYQPGSHQSEEVYAQWVDRLLASPHYGERWGQHWLDVVRYADTAGYDKDKLRPNAWPYRDYVIRSFNMDKPFSRFLHEQIAGDALFPGEPDGILGLGFLAAGPWDWIGHAEVPETKIDGKIARHTDRDEMVSATINTFCSVTIQCCQCHNHKFDPFTQTHYYNLQSVFAAVDKADRVYDDDPEIARQRTELKLALESNKQRIQDLDRTIQQRGGEPLVQLNQRIADLSPRAALASKPPEFGYHSAIAAKADEMKWIELELPKSIDIKQIVLRPCHDEYANIGAGFGFPARYRILVASDSSDAASRDDSASGSWQLIYQSGKDQELNPGLAPRSFECNKTGVRRVRIVADELTPRSGDFIFALAEVEIVTPTDENIASQCTVNALDSIEAPERWGKANLIDGKYAQAKEELAATQLLDARRERETLLRTLVTPEEAAQRAEAQQQLAKIPAQLAALPAGRLVHAAATDFPVVGTFRPTMGKPREIRRLHRGNIQQPRELSTPGTIPLFPDDSGQFDLTADHTEADRRAALARWLTRRDHPLVWRSIVNRIWQYHFGRGIVDSPNDFGRMGAAPSHPELLDYLACEFRDNGESFKWLHKLIVTSRAYRQSSQHDSHNAAIDSDNRYLWRMNRRRLSAEEIRDLQLWISGRLDKKMGGPGYYLFELERPEHSPHYEYHKFDPANPATHRRSIYRFVVRSQPDPYMTTLDCADSAQSTPQRNETLTALQALTMLNSKFSLTMAEHFAQRIESLSKEPSVQVAEAFELTTGRTPSPEELGMLETYRREHGLVNMCRVLFNLSELVYVD
ncbi:MAG: PSD1 and planctomycete cytochrome C domain-containing protein [Pirellula sp.]